MQMGNLTVLVPSLSTNLFVFSDFLLITILKQERTLPFGILNSDLPMSVIFTKNSCRRGTLLRLAGVHLCACSKLHGYSFVKISGPTTNYYQKLVY